MRAFGSLFRSFVPGGAAFFVLLVLASSPGAGEKGVARVNGAYLSEAELQAELIKLIPLASFHGGVSEETKDKYRPEAMDNAIEAELMSQEAKRRGLAVPKGKVRDSRQALIDRLGDKKAYKRALEEKGVTDEQYERMLEKQFLVEIIEEEIRKEAAVSDQEVADYYNANKERYMKPEARRLWHVLVKVEPSAAREVWDAKRKRAEDILRQARAGADIWQLAWDYSDGPYRVKSGDLGLVHKGRLDPAIDEVAFSLEKGRFSGVIKTIYGFHIVKVLDIEEPRQLSLADVSQKIKSETEQQRYSEAREALLARLKKEAMIEVYR